MKYRYMQMGYSAVQIIEEVEVCTTCICHDMATYADTKYCQVVPPLATSTLASWLRAA